MPPPTERRSRDRLKPQWSPIPVPGWTHPATRPPRTIRPTFLVDPRRSPVIAAKLIVGGLVGVIRRRPATTDELAAVGADATGGR